MLAPGADKRHAAALSASSDLNLAVRLWAKLTASNVLVKVLPAF
jgi:hypothetical protein